MIFSLCVDCVCSVSPELLNHSFYQTCCGGVLSWGNVSCRKIGSLFSMSQSQQGLMKSKVWLFLLCLLNCWSICNQTWLIVHYYVNWVSCGKMGLLCSKSRSQRRFKMLVKTCLDDTFWTTEHFVTKSGMVMQHHKPECFVDKWNYCGQGQGHNKGSKCQWMFVLMIFSPCVCNCVYSVSSEPLNHFLPNLVLWCITVLLSCNQT